MGDLPWSPIIALIFTLLALSFTARIGKKITTILFQTRSTYDEIHVTSDVGGTYHWEQTSVGALTIIN